MTRPATRSPARLTDRGQVAYAIAVGTVVGFAIGVLVRLLSNHWTHNATLLVRVVLIALGIGTAVWLVIDAVQREQLRRRESRDALRYLEKSRGGVR